MSFKIEGMPSELDLFSLPVVQTGILDANYYQFKPTSAINDSSQITFQIYGSGDQYIDLSRTLLAIKLQIVKPDGSAFVEADATPGPINNFLDSVFGDIKVEFNGKMVSDSKYMYHIRSYIEDLYNYNNTAKKSHMTASLWKHDVTSF